MENSFKINAYFAEEGEKIENLISYYLIQKMKNNKNIS